MILLTLSRGNEHERVHLRLPASPAEIGEAFVILDGISLDTTTTAILDVRGNVPGLYRYVFRGKGVDREEAASFAAGCIKRLAEPLLDAGYGIEKILCYREEFDWP